MTFSASDAAFEGFRVVRRKPAVILWWSLAYLAFFAVVILMVGAPLLALMPEFASMSETGGDPSPEMFRSMIGMFGVVFLVIFPLAVMFSAVLSTAVARAVLRPAEAKFGYLRLGKDELRVGLVVLVLGFLMMAAYFAAGMAIGLVIAVAHMISAATGILLGIVAGLAAFATLIWISVRLSLAVPITYAEKRIAIFDSFALTKGRFWPLFGMAVIAIVMTLLVAVLGMIVDLPFELMGGVTFDQAVKSGEMAQVVAAISPAVAIGFLINMVLSSLQLAVLYAPFSAAYLGLKGGVA